MRYRFCPNRADNRRVVSATQTDQQLYKSPRETLLEQSFSFKEVNLAASWKIASISAIEIAIAPLKDRTLFSGLSKRLSVLLNMAQIAVKLLVQQ